MGESILAFILGMFTGALLITIFQYKNLYKRIEKLEENQSEKKKILKG